MTRSTQAQKAERLNLAHGLLAEGHSMTEAATVLSREFCLSRRQAYRYLQAAQDLDHPVIAPAVSIPITLKIPNDIVRDLRAHAKTSGMTMGEIVARAVSTFLSTARKHG
jgi:predicted DNA-binding transcriptional regulator YafY